MQISEETAKQLIEAANRLAAAIEQFTSMNNMLGGGIHVHYHGAPNFGPYTPQQPYMPPQWPSIWCGGQNANSGAANFNPANILNGCYTVDNNGNWQKQN
jgi:hypothetical protein